GRGARVAAWRRVVYLAREAGEVYDPGPFARDAPYARAEATLLRRLNAAATDFGPAACSPGRRPPGRGHGKRRGQQRTRHGHPDLRHRCRVTRHTVPHRFARPPGSGLAHLLAESGRRGRGPGRRPDAAARRNRRTDRLADATAP